jgi:large subunit ribosomal protein L22
MKAFLKNYRQSPRKVRLVAGLIRGKRVADVLSILKNLPKRATGPVLKLLNSAISNAKQMGVNEENLIVKEITVNKGIVMKRMMPRARGSASRINKRTSHVEIILMEKTAEVKLKKEKKVVSTKSTANEVKSKSKKLVASS